MSTPSVFVQIKNLLVRTRIGGMPKGCTNIGQATPEYQVRPEVKLLEYDERFAVFKEYVPYDFAMPTRLPRRF